MSSQRITKARIQLMLDEPFFGTLLMGMRMIQNDAIRTMCTDGESIQWNTEFVAKISDQEVKGVLAHEVMHVALLHPFREGSRDHSKWNVACDYAINLELIKNSRFKLPKGGLIEQKYAGMSAEKIYDILPDEPKGSGEKGKKGESDCGCGEVMQPKGDQAKISEAMAKVKVKILEAVQAVKNKGDLPDDIQRLVEDIKNPKVNWKDELREFITQRSKDDYLFTRPNPRYMSTGFILPSLYSQRLGKIAVAVDTSGSINQNELKEFLTEIEGIMHETKPESVILMACDSKIHSKEEYLASDVLPRTLKGGGGTDLRKCFTCLQDEDIFPSCLILFTDLQTDFPNQEPQYPVLWITNGNDKAPFGRTIKI